MAAPAHNVIPIDRLSGNRDQTEYFEVLEDPNETEIVDDDGAFADDPGQREESAPPDEGFYDNLAKFLPPYVRQQIVSDLHRKIDADKEARKQRDEQYEEGIKRTGMGKDAPGGADFAGASKVVHPMLTEASIDYQSRIIKEIWPPSGPVKPSVLGTVTKQKTDKAQRVTDHMNHQITNGIRGARATMEVTLAQVPLGGSQYIRQTWDHRLKGPSWQFAPVDKVLVPVNASDFISATRRTFIDTVDLVEFKNRVASGMYLNLELPAPSSSLSDVTRSEAASRRVEGVEDPGMNLDEDRTLFETLTFLDVTDDMVQAFGHSGSSDTEKRGEMCPYLITFDETGNDMLSMYRAWEEGDPAREPIDVLYEFPFIPWRGAYAIGFPQLIGGLSAAATGALRGLLDAAHVNNVPSAIALKGSGSGGQTKIPNPGEIVEMDGAVETDDIRKRVMPMPYNPPSAVLFQLLGFLEQAGRSVVRTTLDETPQNSGTPVPVGTQLSRVEEGLTVFTAIHGRAHAAMDRLLRGLFRLNRLYLPDEVKVDAAGKEILVRRADYEGPCDVIPVSDPTIYSEMQRFTQLQYIQSRQQLYPQLYKPYQVELAGLKLIKWADPESLLNIVPEPKEDNAVNENLATVLGQPIAAYPDQDHLAHLQVHMDFVSSKALGMNPLMAPTVLPPLLKHCVEHIGYFYATQMKDVVQDASGMKFEELSSDDPGMRSKFDQLLAWASQSATPQVDAALEGKAMPLLLQAMQLAKQVMPPPPMDPAAAAAKAAEAETARKAQDDKARNQLDTAKMALDTKKLELEQQLATLTMQNDQQDAARKHDLAMAEISQKHEIAMAALDQKQNELTQKLDLQQQTLTQQSADRAVELESIARTFEANVLKVLADYETKTNATQQSATDSLNQHVGGKLEDLGQGVNELIKTINSGEGEDTDDGELPAAAMEHLSHGGVTSFANGQKYTLRDGKPARVEAGALPPEAMAHLKDGKMTTFANGTTWTLKGGKPDRVEIPPEALAHLKAGQITTFANGSKWTKKNGKASRVIHE